MNKPDCKMVRVHEVARKSGQSSKEVREQLARLGINTKSPSSSIEQVAAESYAAVFGK